MTVRDRILGALQLGAISAPTLARMLSANEWTVRRELSDLRADGVVTHVPVDGHARARGGAGVYSLAKMNTQGSAPYGR